MATVTTTTTTTVMNIIASTKASVLLRTQPLPALQRRQSSSIINIVINQFTSSIRINSDRDHPCGWLATITSKSRSFQWLTATTAFDNCSIRQSMFRSPQDPIVAFVRAPFQLQHIRCKWTVTTKSAAARIKTNAVKRNDVFETKNGGKKIDLQSKKKCNSGSKKSQTTKKKKKNNEPLLYRADRVVSQRSNMSRSESFDLLRQKRIWQRLDVDHNSDTGCCTNTTIVAESETQSVSPNHPLSSMWQVVTGPACKVDMNAVLFIDRKHEIPRPPPLLAVYHKPKWVLSVRHDPGGRPCLDNSILPQMHPVGRLDYDTTGLLLFSSSGRLTQLLLHPKHALEKEYVAIVVGPIPDPDAIQQALSQGVQTADGVYTAKLISVDNHIYQTTIPEENNNSTSRSHVDDSGSSSSNIITVAEYLEQVRLNLPLEYNQTDLQQRGYLQLLLPEHTSHVSRIVLSVQEGKHRMVRRMLANLGHAVIDLHRQRMGQIVLDDDACPVGTTRQLSPTELSWAEQLLSSSSSSSLSTSPLASNAKPAEVEDEDKQSGTSGILNENSKALQMNEKMNEWME